MSVQHFTYSINNKPLWVGVSLEYDGSIVHVTNIQFEGEGRNEIGIPKNPNFNQENGQWYLFENTIEKLNGIDTIVSRRIDNEHTKHLVRQILQIRDNANPLFTD